MKVHPIFKSPALHCLVAALLTAGAQAQSKKEKKPEPAAFTTNCKACHQPQTDVVGPSLVEIARIYPKEKREQFIQWCIDPGKKRADKAQMPSMAHIPKKELIAVHQYVLEAARGLRRIRMPKADPFEKSKHYTKRPRVFRTFIPDTGPASAIVALPTKDLHNVIWDTDQCALRYITTGQPDGYPYWRSNGNSEAKPGKKVFTESQSVFDPKTTQYLGYKVDKDGYPTFLYTVGNIQISESYSVHDGKILRVIQSASELPKHQLHPSDKSKQLKRSIRQEGNTLTIEYRPKS
ncbi:hypothetical protein JO972_08355 [Verrucomicrobiaceae bacterium 5K15]|uniref:Cytochrome c domain-containing protein n=1 Tax=Oceaniferula flava TaxID=2800421 RepID=A0AAE2V9E4_9BACT|nr:c-type cytochrome [Oceaniferula flavus]MBK1854968.1 hypothetical protein [Oceaniferula flavus]MBM1136274.1 hypothetical protein [Oceaniferula flavus]